MTADLLLAKLQPGGADSDILICPESPILGRLGSYLRDATNAQGRVVIREAKKSDESSLSTLVLTGKATIIGAVCQVKVVFHIDRQGSIASFYILAVPGKAWRLKQSFSKLNCFSGFEFIKPVFVINARQTSISDSFAEREFKGETFDNGLSLYSSGLTKAPASFGLRCLPSFQSAMKGAPTEVKGSLAVKSDRPSISINCWWDTPGAKLGASKVPRMGISYGCGLENPPTKLSTLLWLWELQVGENDEPFVVSCEREKGSKTPPVFEALFESARFLGGGANSLAPLGGSGDTELESGMPFRSNFPQFSLAHMRFSPGEFLAADLVLIDAATRQPYDWEIIKNELSLRRAIVSILRYQKPKFGPKFSVSGIAEISGYDFQVDVDPGQRISGYLISPHGVDALGFATKLFGQPIDFPNPQLQLISADYANNFAEKEVSYGLDVGGHIDLLGNGAFLLEELGFHYTSVAGKATERMISGRVEIGGLPLSLRAEYTSKYGWLFEGSANPFADTDLNKIANDALHLWDASLPDEIPDIRLIQLRLAYASQPKMFRAIAISQWTLPEDLPWGGGSKADVTIDLSTQKNAATGNRELNVRFDWVYTGNSQIQFEAQGMWSPAEKSLSVSWDGEGKETLRLGQLFSELRLNQICDLPEGGDWEIFAFKRLSVVYESSPRRINFVADSDIGDGVLSWDVSLTKGDRLFQATWKGNKQSDKVGIKELITAVGFSSQLKLPDFLGEDVLEFNELVFRYIADPGASLIFIGKSAKNAFKTIFITLEKGQNGQWGLVAGAAFDKSVASLKDVPGIGTFLNTGEGLKGISIKPSYVMFSTIADAKFLPPIYDSESESVIFGQAVGQKKFVSPGSLARTQPFGTVPLRLRKGGVISAKIDLKDSTNPCLENLYRLIGADEIDAQVSVGPDHVDITGLIPGDLHIPTGTQDDWVLHNAFVRIGVTAGGVTVAIGASAHMSLFGDVREFDVSLIIGEEAAEASLHVTKGPALPSPELLPGVRFMDDYYLEIGIQFEPEGLDLGFMGGFYIGDDPSKYSGKSVVVLEMIEEIPNPLYVACSIDKMDLWALFEAYTGIMARIDMAEDALNAADHSLAAHATSVSKAAGMSEESLEFLKTAYKNLQPIFDKVAFHDVAFHFADSLVILPNGQTATPGIGFRGRLDLLGFNMFAFFEAETGSMPHLTGKFEMDPVNLQHIFKCSGDGEGVTTRQAENGSKKGWSYWKDVQKGHRDQGTSDIPHQGSNYVISPGGPVLELTSQHSPFLHANIHVELFSLLHSDLTADISRDGFEFTLSSGAGKVANLTLHSKLKVENGFLFEAGGSASIKLKGDIGPIVPHLSFTKFHLDVGMDAELDLRITDKDFRCIVNGSFEFEGSELDVPELVIDVPFGDVEELAEKVWDHIVDEAEEIFADFIHGLGKFFKDVGKDIEKGVKETEKAVAEAATAAKKEAEKSVKAAENFAKNAAKKGEEMAKDAEKEGKKALADAGAAAKKTYDDAKKEVDQLGKEAEEAAESAKKTVKHLAKDAERFVENMGREISAIADKAEEDMKAAAKAAEQFARHALDAAKATAKKLLNAAKKTAEAIDKEAKKLWKEIGELIAKAKRFVKKTWHAAKHVASTVWHSIF